MRSGSVGGGQTCTFSAINGTASKKKITARVGTLEIAIVPLHVFVFCLFVCFALFFVFWPTYRQSPESCASVLGKQKCIFGWRS